MYNLDDSCKIQLPSYEMISGWSNEYGSLKVDYYHNKEISLNENKKIYSVKDKKFDVTLFYGSNTSKVSCTIKDDTNSCQVKLPNITRNNFEILGWNENKDDTSFKYSVGSLINVDSQKTFYAITRRKINVNFLSNSYVEVNEKIKSCYIYNKNSNCKINAPSVNVKNGEFAGFSLNSSNPSKIDYKSNEIVTSKSITLRPISKKSITVTFDKNGASYIDYSSKSCDVYNGIPCSIKIPNVDKPGMISFGFNEKNSNNYSDGSIYPRYISNISFLFDKDTELIASFDSPYNRNISTYDQRKYNKITADIEKSCSIEHVDKIVNKVMKNWPALFNHNVKISFLSPNTYRTIKDHESSDGIIFGYMEKSFIDIICSKDEDTIVHELIHFIDREYYNKHKNYLSSSSELLKLYNKYKDELSKPLWNFAYKNTREFMAYAAQEYYVKYYMFGLYNGTIPAYLPQDIEEFVVKYLINGID